MKYARALLFTRINAHGYYIVCTLCSYRREVMHSKEPNAAHYAIAQLEERLAPQGRKVTVITQNIDRLHHRSGSKTVIELHGREL